QKLRGEAKSSTVPPLFTENLFRAQKFRLNAAVTVCSQKNRLHTLRGWYSAIFNGRASRILPSSLGRKNASFSPSTHFKISNQY
ncbi:MAG: hypothetical protein IJE83_05070, partial [Oscillospiraceae bacterium]|nr:hypothetical protein [Oscillospiraceae bacterium]